MFAENLGGQDFAAEGQDIEGAPPLDILTPSLTYKCEYKSRSEYMSMGIQVKILV